MFNKRFFELYTEVGQNIRDTSDSTQAVIKRMVNEAYQELLKRSNFKIYDEDYSFTTVSGTKDYALPDNFSKEVYAIDATNDIRLKRVDLQQYANENPNLINTQGSVQDYTVLIQPTREQPSAVSVLTFVSNSALDTSHTAFVRGIKSDNTECMETVNLNGTSSVSTTNSYVSIIGISKESTNGSITITSNSGSITNAIISSETKDYKASIVRLFQTPNTALTINFPYLVKPLPLNNDGDIPVMDGGDFIISRATAKAWRYKRQFLKANEYDKEAERHLEVLQWDQENQPNQEHVFNVMAYNRDIA